MPFDGSALVEAGVVAERAQVGVGDKARHLVDLAHTSQGEAHLTRTAGRRCVCSQAHGVTCRSLESFLDGPASVAQQSQLLCNVTPVSFFEQKQGQKADLCSESPIY